MSLDASGEGLGELLLVQLDLLAKKYTYQPPKSLTESFLRLFDRLPFTFLKVRPSQEEMGVINWVIQNGDIKKGNTEQKISTIFRYLHGHHIAEQCRHEAVINHNDFLADYLDLKNRLQRLKDSEEDRFSILSLFEGLKDCDRPHDAINHYKEMALEGELLTLANRGGQTILHFLCRVPKDTSSLAKREAYLKELFTLASSRGLLEDLLLSRDKRNRTALEVALTGPPDVFNRGSIIGLLLGADRAIANKLLHEGSSVPIAHQFIARASELSEALTIMQDLSLTKELLQTTDQSGRRPWIKNPSPDCLAAIIEHNLFHELLRVHPSEDEIVPLLKKTLNSCYQKKNHAAFESVLKEAHKLGLVNKVLDLESAEQNRLFHTSLENKDIPFVITILKESQSWTFIEPQTRLLLFQLAKEVPAVSHALAASLAQNPNLKKFVYDATLNPKQISDLCEMAIKNSQMREMLSTALLRHIDTPIHAAIEYETLLPFIELVKADPKFASSFAETLTIQSRERGGATPLHVAMEHPNSLKLLMDLAEVNHTIKTAVRDALRMTTKAGSPFDFAFKSAKSTDVLSELVKTDDTLIDALSELLLSRPNETWIENSVVRLLRTPSSMRLVCETAIKKQKLMEVVTSVLSQRDPEVQAAFHLAAEQFPETLDAFLRLSTQYWEVAEAVATMLNEPDDQGVTPLMILCRNHKSSLKELLKLYKNNETIYAAAQKELPLLELYLIYDPDLAVALCLELAKEKGLSPNALAVKEIHPSLITKEFTEKLQGK